MSGSETALTAVSKPRIISKVNQGNKRAIYVKNLINNKENIISSLLFYYTLVFIRLFIKMVAKLKLHYHLYTVKLLR